MKQLDRLLLDFPDSILLFGSMLTGSVESIAGVAHTNLIGPDDVLLSSLPMWRGRVTELVGVHGRRGVGQHEPECSTSGWFLNRPWSSPNQRRPGLQPWKSGDVLRMLSTASTSDRDGLKSLEEKEASTEQKARPKTIDDFQHEEIVGPTVERDMSDTANQLRSSLGDLTTFMTNLRNAFVLLGSVQLLAALWSSYFHSVGLLHALSQDLAFVVSFILAYLLRYFVSTVLFFGRVEERGRMKILTLSLQVAKMLGLFFFRSDFVVKAVAFGSLLALLGEVWHSFPSV